MSSLEPEKRIVLLSRALTIKALFGWLVASQPAGVFLSHQFSTSHQLPSSIFLSQ
jgi:hypothetical protein